MNVKDIKVFYDGECEYVAARTLEEAQKFWAGHTGNEEEFFDGQEFELDSMMWKECTKEVTEEILEKDAAIYIMPQDTHEQRMEVVKARWDLGYWKFGSGWVEKMTFEEGIKENLEEMEEFKPFVLCGNEV